MKKYLVSGFILTLLGLISACGSEGINDNISGQSTSVEQLEDSFFAVEETDSQAGYLFFGATDVDSASEYRVYLTSADFEFSDMGEFLVQRVGLNDVSGVFVPFDDSTSRVCLYASACVDGFEGDISCLDIQGAEGSQSGPLSKGLGYVDFADSLDGCTFDIVLSNL